MKKLLCLLLCSVLIFSSVSLCFAADATWSTTDSQNLSNVAGRLYYMNQSAAYYLYNIASNTNNIYNKCVDIYNALFYGNHNITYWVNAISSWMSPIYNALTSLPTDLSTIIGSLGYYDNNNTYHPYLNNINQGFFENTYDLWVSTLEPNGGNGSWQNYHYNWATSMYSLLASLVGKVTNIYQYEYLYGANGYSTTQNVVNWGNLGTSTFTPISITDGLYKYLASIQAPVARLSYVLASDERIEAQQAAAANEEAVVDNFIDSTGDGSISTSDIGSVSDLSAGYKQNFGSDASPSGIFDIFNSDHATWFSQETKNQLDTTTPTRLTKSQESETPLLDKQIQDIYDALGVKQP